ncbi:MAG: acyl carrier protein [Myxococcota bacterium]
MEIQAVIDRVNQILVDEFELDPDQVVAEATLRDDLQLDSLDGMDLIVALEKEFQVRVDEKALLKLQTVGDVHAYLREVFETHQAQQSA